MQVVNPRQVQELRLYGLWHVRQQVRRRLSVNGTPTRERERRALHGGT